MSNLVETVTLADEDLVAEVLPSRGLDIGTATLGSVRFSWQSPLGHVPWQGDFARSFGGGSRRRSKPRSTRSDSCSCSGCS